MVDRGGFEPPKSKTSDLQSDPFGRSGICPILYAFLFRGISITCRRKGWCLKVESNRRQRDFQSLALPTELSRHLATQTRLELVTSSVTGWRSNQLSYWAVATKQFFCATLIYNKLFLPFCQAFFGRFI